MTWQYWTVSEKRRANAERLTSCLPRLSDLSRILVFGLHHISHIVNFNTPFASGGPCELQNTVLVRKIGGEKETAILCGLAQLTGQSSILGSAPHGGSSLGERRSDDDIRREASANGKG